MNIYIPENCSQCDSVWINYGNNGQNLWYCCENCGHVEEDVLNIDSVYSNIKEKCQNNMGITEIKVFSKKS